MAQSMGTCKEMQIKLMMYHPQQRQMEMIISSFSVPNSIKNRFQNL